MLQTLYRCWPWSARWQAKLSAAVLLLVLLLLVNVVNVYLRLPWFVWGQIPVSLALGYVAGRLIRAALDQQHAEYLRARGVECDSCKH